MKKSWIAYALLIAFAVQSAAIGYVIWGHYQALSKGKRFLFQTQPIDPRDYFRGQYVALSFVADDEAIASNLCQKAYQEIAAPIYLQLSANKEGIASVSSASVQAPENDDYLVLQKSAHCNDEKRLVFRLPFKRYYANENKAQEMEMAARKSPDETFLQVAVYRGHYAVENLILPIAHGKGKP